MKVFSKKTLEDYYKKSNQSKKSLDTWYQEALNAEWKIPQNIKDRYPAASFLHDNLVVFNIKGNDYRLVTRIDYKKKRIFVKWIGTHKEYDKMTF